MPATGAEPGDPPAHRPATLREARALSNPLRLRIIRETLDEPLTNAEIAERLGRDKATVLHHVRVLADTGFLEALPVRRGVRGAREIPYRGTGKSWRLSIGDSKARSDVDDAMMAAFLEEYDAAKALEPPNHSRLALRLTPAEHEEFSDRMHALLDEFAKRRTTSDGVPYAVFVTTYRR